MAFSLFEAVATVLHWWEVECQHYGMAHRLPDSAVLEVHLVAGERYWVQVRESEGVDCPLIACSISLIQARDAGLRSIDF